MKTIITQPKYQCEICQKIYDHEAQAIKCESRPIQHDRGVKVGDIVKIINGDGKGEKAKVTRIGIFDAEYGHYQADAYHHSVYLLADCIESFGSRQLAFTDYEIM